MRRLAPGLWLAMSIGLLAATAAWGQESPPERQEPKERPMSPHTFSAPAPSPPPAPAPAPPPTSPVAEPRAHGADAGEVRTRGHSVRWARPDDADLGVHRAVPRAASGYSRAIAVPDPPDASVPPYSRPREGRPVVGAAVVRQPGGYWPDDHPPDWDWGYDWLYYPWGFGVWSLYDPFWGPGSDYDGYYGGTAYVATNVGHVKVKVRPNEAQVYVDGYYVGVVDEFDGPFQRLSLPEGPHRVEVKAQGFATLALDVRVLVNHTITVRGELRRQP